MTRDPAAEDPTIPAIGFGTAPMDDAQTELAVADALAAGYRLIDTAAAYGNEAGVGRAIAATAVPRAEVLVITKLPGRSHGYEATLTSFEESRRRLGLSYLDFYLIHWPLPSLDAYVESWRALIHLRSRGLVRHIGVSNFLPAHITRLIEETGVAPAVNQVELHPGFPQAELRAFHDAHGIRTLAYSPLGRGPAGLGADLLGGGEIAAIARVHGVTPARAVLRWHIQLRSVPLTRTSSPRRRRENLDVFGFTLTPDEMDRITGNPPYTRVGFEPATHMEYLLETGCGNSRGLSKSLQRASKVIRLPATGRPATDRSIGAFGCSPSVATRLSRYAARARIEFPPGQASGMHSLRGALAVAMIGNGTPMPVISAVLGHASTDTTQAYYLRFDTERLRCCALDVEDVLGQAGAGERSA